MLIFLHFLTFLMKSFPAKLAHERFVSRVDARVRVESGAAIKGFPALVTLVRFFLEKIKKSGRQILSRWKPAHPIEMRFLKDFYKDASPDDQ